MDVFASVFREPRPPVAVVGAGAVGRAMALRLAERGYPVVAVVSRTLGRAEAVARLVGAPMASDRLADVPPEAALVLVCVGDDQIEDVAEGLLAARVDWPGAVVAHTSGALTAAALEPLADAGATALSFHPLQTVAPGAGAEALEGIYAGLEGPPRGVAAGIELAVGLGLRYVVVPAESKGRYHLAASVASNFLVTLVAIAQEVLGSVDIDRRDSLAMLEPLLRGTLDSLAARGPEDALTGPVVRGDLHTLRRHGVALRQHLPQLVPAYASLGVEAVRVAVRSGRLDPDRAERVLELLQRMVTVPLPGRSPEASGERGGDRPPARSGVEAG